MSSTKARVIQYVVILLILSLFGGGYWYFNVRAAVTLNKSGVSGTAKTNASINALSTNGLVGEWSFNGADVSGTTAYDRSGQGNNGTLTNDPTKTIGKLGQAINFDGTDDHITMGAPSVLNITGALTISAWIYPETFGGGGGKGRIVDKDSDVTTGYIFAVDNVTVANGFAFLVNTATTSPVLYLGAASSITLNTWQHVTVTMDDSKVATLYKNGVYLTSATFSAFPASNSNNFVIGGRTTDNERNFDGIIDEARVYNRALTATEVANLYALGAAKINASQNTRATDGIVGLWSFNGPDVSGTTAYDRSGNSYNGTLTNGAAPTSGKIGQALHMSRASSQYVSVVSNVLNTPSAISISAWVHMTASNGSTSYLIASNRTAGNAGWSAGIKNCSGTNPIKCNLSFTIQGVAEYVTTDSLLTGYPRQWNHVTFTWDGSNVRYYVNGVQSATVSATGSMTTGSQMVIGAQGPSSSPGSFFDGYLDEVRVYNRTLSATEITALYNAGR